MKTSKVIPLVQLAQNSASKLKKFHSGTLNEFLKYQEVNPLELLVPDSYQRDISYTDINKNYKQFNKRHCVPLIIAVRPNGDKVIVDGQHKALMAVLSRENFKVPAMAYIHDENSTESEWERIESEIFYALNAKRKNPSYVDKMRAGYLFDMSEAREYHNNLGACGLYVDSLGDTDGIELNGEYQWRQAVKKYEIPIVKKASAFAIHFDKIWKKNEVRGDMIYGLSCLISFLENPNQDFQKTLNGRKNNLYRFIETQITQQKQKVWYEGISGSATDVLIARRIIQRYNESSNTPKSQCFPEEFLSANGLKDPTR
jgi:hypothetical protein